MITFKIKAENDMKVVEKLLSLCRRKLYKLQSINAEISGDEYIRISLTFSDLDDGRKGVVANNIKGIIEVIDATIQPQIRTQEVLKDENINKLSCPYGVSISEIVKEEKT